MTQTMPLESMQSYGNYAHHAISIITILCLFADDIITPVYVAPTRSPTTYRPKHHKENIQERPSCDDEEDCGEGSGEPVTTEEIFVTSATGSFRFNFFFFFSFFFPFFPSHPISVCFTSEHATRRIDLPRHALFSFTSY